MNQNVSVKFRQRCFRDSDAGATSITATGAAAADGCRDGTGGRSLYNTLFHPIAGDALSRQSSNGDNCAVPMATLRHVQFGILDAATVQRMSVVTVTTPLVNDSPGSLTDLRMGASLERHQPCQTCNEYHHNCPGHFGRIVLPHPVVNPLFVTLLVNVLQTVCMNCHRLRVSPFFILAQFPGHTTTGMRQLQRLKTIGAFCVRFTHCQFCHAPTLNFARDVTLLHVPFPKPMGFVS